MDKGELHFSPKYTFWKIEDALNKNDKGFLIKAFKDRLEGFYLEPAKKLNCLNKDDYAFAVGVLCVSTIDCLACITINPHDVGMRFKGWVKDNLPDFGKCDPSNKIFACRFYDEFRNGLVHEGRIKNGGQFSNKSEKLVEILKGAMLVNPDILLKKINDSFEIYISKVEKDNTNSEFGKLKDYLESFDKELKYANSC